MPHIEDVYPWSIWCVTEGAWITGNASSPPTTCFTNAGHTVDTESYPVRRHIVLARELAFVNTTTTPNIEMTTIIDGLELRDDATDTPYLERNYTSNMVWISPPYPIALAGMQCHPSPEQASDIINMWMYKDMTVAGLAVSSTAGDDIFTLSAVTILKTGMEIAINGEDLGEIIDVDTSTNRIMTSVASTIDHTLGETVTFAIRMIRNLVLGSRGEGRITFGEFTPGSMILQPSTPCVIQYINNHNRSERLDIILEYQRGSQNLGLL